MVKKSFSLTPSNKKGQTIKVLKQVGKSHMKRDAGRLASLPGKRISKSGKVYWETRKNRSDAAMKRV